MIEKNGERNMFEILQEDILTCRLCRERFGHEPQPVIFGHADAPIMQISQAPSLTVHETHKPFNDMSGRKLRNDWYHISDEVFYNEDNFYITSIAHCYPGKSKNGGDRLPPKCCADKWLKKEMEYVHNEIYILIGGKAAEYLFPGENFNDLIFNQNTLNGKPAFVLPHPSPLNIKWFKDNPDFLNNRIHEIRKVVHEVLNL